MAILDGRALTEARGKKKWTQVQLSDATKPKVDVSTISRIERGKSNRVQSKTLTALAKALDVSPESLSPTAEAERDVMKLRIEVAARNALTLVARRYRVSRENIIEIAPLLFFIAAEQSLQERRKRITDVRASADALFDLQRNIRHLPRHWPIDDGAVSSEEQSIKDRDLFGEKFFESAHLFLGDLDDDYDQAEQNPFVTFLRSNLENVSNSSEAAESIHWSPGLWPRYEICADEAAAIVGDDPKAAHAIICGAAPLHEVPKGTPEQRAQWARGEFERKYGGLLEDLLGAPAAEETVEGEKP